MRGKLDETDDTELIGLAVAGSVGSHVRHHDIGAAAEHRHQPVRRVIAIDRLGMSPVAGVEFARLDFLDAGAPDAVKSLLAGAADVVLSDMAENATGHRRTDHLKIVALAEAAADFAREVLAPGGAFLCKVLQGGAETTLLAALKRDFAAVRHLKPTASRSESAELYLLATGFRKSAAPIARADE